MNEEFIYWLIGQSAALAVSLLVNWSQRKDYKESIKTHNNQLEKLNEYQRKQLDIYLEYLKSANNEQS